jgi:hypothetical protein
MTVYGNVFRIKSTEFISKKEKIGLEMPKRFTSRDRLKGRFLGGKRAKCNAQNGNWLQSWCRSALNWAWSNRGLP